MKHDKVSVSVIIPVYNAERYICDCVNSVLMQSYPYFELILVDDGSSDKSPILCDEFALNDSRIQVIHQKNKGVAGARNAGIDNCSGEYIVFLDADDWWDENYLAYMVAKQNDYDTVICELVKHAPDGREFMDCSFECDMNEWCWPIKNNYSIACNRCIFKRNIIESKHIRFKIGRKTGEDQEFTYRYMLHVEKIGVEPNAKYFYRINPNSIMFNANYDHFHAVDAMIAIEEYASEVCEEKRSEVIKEALRNYKYPYILENAVLSVITSGDKPHKVISYLLEKGYYNLLNSACKNNNHYKSTFMNMWGLSPQLCLQYYYVRRKVGKVIRSQMQKR